MFYHLYGKAVIPLHTVIILLIFMAQLGIIPHARTHLKHVPIEAQVAMIHPHVK